MPKSRRSMMQQRRKPTRLSYSPFGGGTTLLSVLSFLGVLVQELLFHHLIQEGISMLFELYVKTVSELTSDVAVISMGAITSDRSGSNPAAIRHYNKLHKTASVIRQSKYLKNLVEPDQRAGKRLTHPLLGCKSFWAAGGTIAGLEVRPAMRTGQRTSTGHAPPPPAEQFYAVAA